MPEREVLTLVQTGPNEELVEYLEALLMNAKSGALRSITGAAVWRGYDHSMIDCGRDGKYRRMMVGQLEVVKQHVIDEVIEDMYSGPEEPGGGPA